MARYRKKPIEIEARQLGGTVESANRTLGWIGSNGGDAKRVHATKPESGLVIRTVEGDMRANVGDWIIKGVAGEFYPCQDDIFRATYEAVTD
jgi:hypothetical protein